MSEMVETTKATSEDDKAPSVPSEEASAGAGEQGPGQDRINEKSTAHCKLQNWKRYNRMLIFNRTTFKSIDITLQYALLTTAESRGLTLTKIVSRCLKDRR